MTIIRKENAEGIAPFSFAQDMGEAPPAQEWRVTGGSGSIPVGHEGEQALPLEAQEIEPSAPSLEPEPQDVAPAQPVGPPPVFEISEDILGAFYEQAIMAGLEEGKAQVLAELGILQERFSGALSSLTGVSRELAAQNQVQLITMACRIAEKLVRDELSVRPEKLMALIADALKETEGQSEVLVRCSPMDFDYLHERQPELAAGAGGSFTVRIEAHPELEYGDFQIEAARGNVDGRVASRIEEVEGQLKEPGADV